MMRERPSDFIDEDWVLIAEALAHWAGEPQNVENDRQKRAYLLIEAIALELDCSMGELRKLREGIDHDLTPPNENFQA